MKVIVTILSAVLLFALSACGGSTSQNQSQTEKTTKKTEDATQASNTKSSNSTQANQETFYGTWQIKKVIAYGPAGTYSSDDIKTLTGKQLAFSKDRATCFGDKIETINKTISNPVYKKSVIAKKDFRSDYRVTFDQLGFTEDTITEVDATSNGICTVLFISPNNNKLVLYGGGTFFELDHSHPSDEDIQKQSTLDENKQKKAVSLVKEYLRDKNELVEDKNHFVLFDGIINNHIIVRYSTLVSGHSSTNGRYAVNLITGKVVDVSANPNVLNNTNNIKNVNGFTPNEKQSFAVNLKSWGNVKFVSGKITGGNHVPTVFYLTSKNGEILYRFEDSPFPYNVDVKAVSFHDVNKDGLKDVIVIASDKDNDGKPIAAVWLQNASKTFTCDTKVSQEMNDSGNNADIKTVTDYLSKKF